MYLIINTNDVQPQGSFAQPVVWCPDTAPDLASLGQELVMEHRVCGAHKVSSTGKKQGLY